MILRSEHSAVIRIAAINSFAMPVMTYSMNIIDWQMNDIKNLVTKTRILLTMYRMYHPKANVDWHYLTRNEKAKKVSILAQTNFLIQNMY